MFKHFTRGLVAALALFAVTPQLQAQAFSDYVENKIVDALLRNQTLPDDHQRLRRSLDRGVQ